MPHSFQALANEDTLLPTQMFPRLPVRATFVADTKNVSDFVQKHFVSATNVSQFAQPKKHHGQQCVRNNVSSFTRAFRINRTTMRRTWTRPTMSPKDYYDYTRVQWKVTTDSLKARHWLILTCCSFFFFFFLSFLSCPITFLGWFSSPLNSCLLHRQIHPQWTCPLFPMTSSSGRFIGIRSISLYPFRPQPEVKSTVSSSFFKREWGANPLRVEG